jgi:CheY-like chemotaxis protein
MLNGNIGVESTLGKGSLFRVELPVALASPADILKPETRKPDEVVGLAPGQPRYKIMIVEDQRENQLLISRLMTELGLEVKIAGNGEQCLEMFQDWRPDLIWMDRQMPVMDGIEATQRLRQLPEGQTVKIVAVTASAFKEQQQEMLDAGMDDFVRKPYRFDEIYDCLARQLGVEYVYHDEAPTDASPPATLDAAMLAALPASLRQELRAALEDLDSERISAVIRLIGETDLKLGHTLSQLADYFDYPAILAALSAQLQDSPKPTNPAITGKE